MKNYIVTISFVDGLSITREAEAANPVDAVSSLGSTEYFNVHGDDVETANLWYPASAVLRYDVVEAKPARRRHAVRSKASK